MRGDYCPAVNEPCQSMCDVPCKSRKPLSKKVIDLIANDGMRNAEGGIYSTCVYKFAYAIEAAVLGITEQEPTE
jgi:hypothetical protein